MRLVVLQSVDMFVLLRAVGFGALQQHGGRGRAAAGGGRAGDGRRRRGDHDLGLLSLDAGLGGILLAGATLPLVAGFWTGRHEGRGGRGGRGRTRTVRRPSTPLHAPVPQLTVHG